MFAFCFRGGFEGEIGPVKSGGLMRELDNLQMDDFTDLCQGFNKQFGNINHWLCRYCTEINLHNFHFIPSIHLKFVFYCSGNNPWWPIDHDRIILNERILNP